MSRTVSDFRERKRQASGPAAINLWHGYTLADIDRIARTVIAIDRWTKTMDTTERLAAARFAITEHLLTTNEAPTKQDLINIGRSASNRHVEAEMRYRGYDMRHPAHGQGSLPGFQRYWQGNPHAPFDERLAEHMSLAQIWPHLTVAQQQAVWALALTEDYRAAADILGLAPPAFASRLKKARHRFAALWHEHETPRRQPMDKRVLARSGWYRGRRLLTKQDLEALRGRRADGATLRQLAAETGYSAGALCNLLKGKRRPAPDAGKAAPAPAGTEAA